MTQSANSDKTFDPQDGFVTTTPEVDWLTDDLSDFDHPAMLNDAVSDGNADITMGQRVWQWRMNRGLDASPGWIAAKLLEEAGETARAVIGSHEGRKDRGDILQEAAQTVIVLMALVESILPGSDLYAAVDREMERLGA